MKFLRACISGLAVLSLLAVTAPADLAAQDPAPEVYTACYVPLTGTVYRIKTANTRPACASPSHVEFSWNEEGPQGPPGPQGEKGEKGDKGDKGDPGTAGSFSGTFKSPNGDYILSITDDGIVFQGPSSAVAINPKGVEVTTNGSAQVKVVSDEMTFETEELALKSPTASLVTLAAADRLAVRARDDLTLESTLDNVLLEGDDVILEPQNHLQFVVGGNLAANVGGSTNVTTGNSFALQSGSGMSISSGLGLTMEAAQAMALEAGTSLELETPISLVQLASGLLLQSSGPAVLGGTTVKLGGCSGARPIVRHGDPVTGGAAVLSSTGTSFAC